MEKQFLVALHAHSKEQVLEEAKKILTPDGAHGVLIVNNGGHVLSDEEIYPNLFDIAIDVKYKYPNYFIGVNPLDLSTLDALEASCASQIKNMELLQSDKIFDALWTDDGGIRENENGAFLPENLQYNLSLRAGLQSFGIQYFGGVAFKYRPQPQSLELVAKEAAKYFSVVVTSGLATGAPADVEKIKTIKDYIGPVPLALASGVTEENLQQYYKYVEVFIVGTSLQLKKENPYEYSKEKIVSFRTRFESLQKAPA
jgi:uncharacterized protein